MTTTPFSIRRALVQQSGGLRFKSWLGYLVFVHSKNGIPSYSMPAVEYSKQFVTSLVVGKDIVTRVGLSQMEYLRTDLLDCIKRSTDPKVRLAVTRVPGIG